MSSKRAYRSGFEERMGDILCPAGALYEPYKIMYWTESNYTPDFVLDTPSGERILVECKGWFRPGDQKKYKAIRDSVAKEFSELVFLLQKPNHRVRKGAQLTMSGWCDKEGIPWFGCPEGVLKYANGR